MPRRPRALNPGDNPLDAFALELRALRDRAGPTAPSPDDIAKQQGRHRATIFAALSGTRVPSRDTLTAIVKAWGGDQGEWLAKRSALENALATARQVQHQERHPRQGQDKGHDPITWGELDQAGVTWGQLSGQPTLPVKNSRSEQETAFGRELRRLRTTAGSTQEKIAEKAYISRATLVLVEAGRGKPTLRTVEAIVRAITDSEDQVQAWRQKWLQLRNS